MWLILNGKIARPWEQVGSLTVRDWHGNELHLPTTAAISLTFSLASIAKAIIDFNIIRVHIEDVSSARKVLQSVELILSHLPFLASAAFFRVATVIVLLTYVNAFAFLPVAIFWFCCLAIGYRRFQDTLILNLEILYCKILKLFSFNLEKIPLWLISFISLFFPICFTTHPVTPKYGQITQI